MTPGSNKRFTGLICGGVLPCRFDRNESVPWATQLGDYREPELLGYATSVWTLT